MAKTLKLRSPQRAKTRNLAIAIFLLLLSVAGVNYVIATNNQTQEFLVAARDLPAGSPVSAADVASASVNLGEGEAQYLKATELPGASYLLGPIREGQLIPRSMMATAVLDERVPLVVNSAMGLAAGLVAGASVDLWVTPISENKTAGEPYALVLGAEVSRLLEKTEMFSNQNPDVELWVPVTAVGPVLAAISAESKISLVLRPTLADG
ncbi:MAG: hypothetical protein RL351_537 [Actinomycetota bacterium]|jgi:hypothetical protein